MTIPIVMMILADISMMKFSNLTVQVYSPESAESTDSEVSWLLDDMTCIGVGKLCRHNFEHNRFV